MTSQSIIAIAATDKNGAIGFENDLIFKNKEDLAHFRNTTTGHKVLIGRKTFESIKMPLKDRFVYVLTSDKNFKAEGVTVFNDIQSVLKSLHKTDKLFIAGGAEIYKLTMPLWTELILTIFDKVAPNADAYFPQWYSELWKENHSDKRTDFEVKHYVKTNCFNIDR